MTFTDDDLKQLREYAWYGDYPEMMTAEKLLALLARLEVAEQWCAYCWSVACNEGTYSEEEVAQLERWRKAAGK